MQIVFDARNAFNIAVKSVSFYSYKVSKNGFCLRGKFANLTRKILWRFSVLLIEREDLVSDQIKVDRYTVKKVVYFPVSSRDVTNPTLPGMGII